MASKRRNAESVSSYDVVELRTEQSEGQQVPVHKTIGVPALMPAPLYRPCTASGSALVWDAMSITSKFCRPNRLESVIDLYVTVIHSMRDLAAFPN